MRLLWIMACGGTIAWLAGCGEAEQAPDRAPPIRYAPANGDGAAEATSSPHGGRPAGHPRLDAGSGGGQDVLRTGPSMLTFPGPGLTFSVPAGWKELRPQAMDSGVIDARLAVPVEGAAVEPQITMSHSGGGTELNINRWKGQFPNAMGDDVLEETVSVDGTDATWIHLRGEFRDPFRPPRPEHSDWAVIGVAIPLGGDRDFYVKLSGPRAAVQSVRDDFHAFITGARLD